jgi:lysophospholipase L1-like esterase
MSAPILPSMTPASETPPGAPEPHRRGRALAGWALSLLISLVLGALALEGAIRLRQGRRYGADLNLDAKVLDPSTGLRVPRPGQWKGERVSLTVNALNFRGPLPETPKPARRVRLAFLGASTTFCAEASSDDTTWPAQTLARLRVRFPEADLDHLNAAVPGFVVDDAHKRLVHHLPPHRPDAVIYYELTNDLSRDTRALAREAGLPVSLDPPSGILSSSMAWRLLRLQLDIAEQQRRAATGAGALGYDAEALARGFEARLTALVQEARRQGALVALVTFTHRARQGQSREEQLANAQTALYYMPYMSIDGLLAGYDAYNAAIRRVAAREEVILIEGAAMVPADAQHFSDSVHLLDPGLAKLGTAVAEGLAAAPAFQALLAERAAR